MNFIKSQEHSNYIRHTCQLHLENLLKITYHVNFIPVSKYAGPPPTWPIFFWTQCLNTASKEKFRLPKGKVVQDNHWGIGEIY